jgi:hypothetical protein
MLELVIDQMAFSTRTHDRILKVLVFEGDVRMEVRVRNGSPYWTVLCNGRSRLPTR